jgi:hypothetical protein
MALAVERIVLIAALVILFFGLALYGWDLCEKEGFTNATTDSSAPTRASDCRCLPGYIPSNTRGNNNLNGKLIKAAEQGRMFILYNPNNTNNYYIVTIASIEDFDKMYENFRVCNKKLSKYPISRAFYNTAELYKIIRTEQWNIQWFDQRGDCKIFEENGDVDSTYFCQSLSDPTQTKSCY